MKIKKIIIIPFLLFLFESAFCQDSMLLYFLPIRSTTHSTVTINNISLHSEPYTITDTQLTNNFITLLTKNISNENSIGVFTPELNDIRVLIKLFKGGKINRSYSINYNGKIIYDESMSYKLNNLNEILCLIQHKIKPQSDFQQKRFLFPANLPCL